jgi:hypothetical protein
MWLAITGSDLLYTSAVAKAKYDAAKQLAKDLEKEKANLNSYAPTLHKKLEEFIEYEKKIKWSKLGKQLPETVVKDDKTQGMVAGILFGKATIAPGVLTGWTVFFTILIQAATKSATNVPNAYGEVIDNRYAPILNDLLNLNYNNPGEVTIAAQKVVHIMKESGVEVTLAEAGQIIIEVNNNPEKLYQSIKNIKKSFEEFTWKLKS